MERRIETLSNPQQVLRCFLIPFPDGQVVLPTSLVAEVLPFATPLKIEHAPSWVVGAMLWGARTTPLVSLGQLCFNQSPTRGNSRIIVVHALSNEPKLRSYGLLASDAPHLIDLTRSNIVLDQEAEPCAQECLLNRVKVNGKPAIIPDLDAIERRLAPLLN